MEFVKKNLISVIAVALAIIGIPVMVYFSSGWNADNKKRLEDGVSSAMQVIQNTRVNYAMPAVTSDGQAWEQRVEPSQLKNQTMEQRLSMLVERSEAAQRVIEELNSAGKALLVDDDARYGDLFPAYANESARVALLTRMMKAYPEAHQAMLERAGVRGPLPEERVRSQIEAQRTREIAAIVSNRVEQELSDEEMQRVRERLGALRRDLYASHAGDTTFFGTPELFTGVPTLDPEAGDEIITHELAWEWQHRLWVHEDLLGALIDANTDADDDDSVLTGPVKRVVEISVDPWPMPEQVSGVSEQSGLATPIPLDYSKAHTGLNAWTERPNPLYDLRYATVRLIADGDRIHEIVKAISTTNLMSVIDLDFREYDGEADLARGYDYGGGQTVALTLRVQTAWLRSWMKQDMPASVRAMLGIPADAPASTSNPDDAF
ncbi:MAG: hypothetical protein Tsb0013_22070 [Phycisphaerales bacterium]